MTKHHLPILVEPTCVSKAIEDPFWREAMSNEFKALLTIKTWTLLSEERLKM